MPYCRNCGHSVAKEARVCPNCNYPQDAAAAAPIPPQTPQPPQMPAPPAQVSAPQAFPGGAVMVRKTDGQAVAALVLGIFAYVGCPVVPAIIAIILGRQSMNRIEASGGTLDGYGMAKAGWILGIVHLALIGIAIVLIVMLAVFGEFAVQGF